MISSQTSMLSGKSGHFPPDSDFILPATTQLQYKYAILLALILLNSFFNLQGQLSNQARASILTCAPGDALYSVFGHSAIRISDPENQVDYVFNYGTFDFDTPGFYLKFLRGQLDYMLAVSSYEGFLREYNYYHRSVWEQPLNMSLHEKNNLFKALMENARPENRFYRYHFFYDNCATRIRDAAVNQVDGGVQFAVFPRQPEEKMSYRQALATYLVRKHWTRLGLDLILGQPTDEPVDGSTIQFLPSFLMDQFATSVRLQDRTEVVGNSSILLDFSNAETSENIKPILLFWLAALLLMVVTCLSHRKGKSTAWMDGILFSTTGAIGVLITFLWFFTEHSVTGPNWHLLWANPLHLLMVAGPHRVLKHMKPLYWITLVGVVFMILFFYWIPQYIPLSLIPIWLLLAFRMLLPHARRPEFCIPDSFKFIKLGLK
jgi:hypothetical protein